MYNKPNFEEYTREELVEAKRYLDKELYPDRYDEILALMNDPNHEPKNKIETHEKSVPNPYSTFKYRFLALCIDHILIALISLLLCILIYTYNERIYFFYDPIHMFICAIYFFFMHGLCDGQTVGKMFLKIKVVSYLDENKISIFQALIREPVNIMMFTLSVVFLGVPSIFSDNIKFIQNIPMVWYTVILMWYLVDIITTLSNDKRRSAHDYLASTVVIRK
ncbi:hypothetical protein JL49_22610 [Pseudoalteromonas luteoviolacea]|nr:hypothetical protein JL49_22610 [Pseudoalteromonas luteoviolacea]